jgi:hypothetical protein
VVQNPLSHISNYPAQAPRVKRSRKKPATGTGEDETDGETTHEAGNKVHPPQRAPGRVTRSNPGAGDESTGDEDPSAPVTPKAKPPRPRPLRRKTTTPPPLSETAVAAAATTTTTEDVVHDPTSLIPASSSSPSSTTMQEVELEGEPFPTSSPQSSRKRPRSEDRDDEEMSEAATMESGPPGSPEGPEIEVHRKRVRH